MRIVVVGAGIGGLTCAIALRQAGFEPEIVEKATSLEEVGAGISLWPNALAALGEIDLETDVVSVGCEMPIASFRRPSGEHLRIFEADQVHRFLGGVPVILHRGELQRVLLDAADGIPVTLGLRCERVRVHAEGVAVQFADGSGQSADLVVGADGIRSAVRNSIAPGKPRYVGLTGWRAVIDGHPLEDSWLTVGEGKQFLAAGLSEGRTYLAGVVGAPEGFIEGLATMGPFLHHTFAGWHEPVADLIRATPEASYIRDDFYDRQPPTQLCWDRVALIGDAAHPVTPDLGQGGCLAIEDAIVLARCLRIETRVEEALKLFERARLRRIRTIVFESHWMGQVFGSSNHLVDAARTVALRMTPASIRLRSLARTASRNAFVRRLPGAK